MKSRSRVRSKKRCWRSRSSGYYTKDEILERYLNIIYLGAGAYGVDAAAHTYFGRSVSALTDGQAAMLAGVVAAPSDYSPFVTSNWRATGSSTCSTAWWKAAT